MACTRPDIAHLRNTKYILIHFISLEIKITAGANELLGDAMCPRGNFPFAHRQRDKTANRFIKRVRWAPSASAGTYTSIWDLSPHTFPTSPRAVFTTASPKKGGSNAITAHMEISLLDTFDPQVRNLEAAGNLTRKVPLTGMALGNR